MEIERGRVLNLELNLVHGEFEIESVMPQGDWAIQVKRGDRIMAMVAAANMDPQANEHPERLDLQRRPNRHLSFGTGIHFCLGHQLARIEGMCALQALFTRWPRLQLAVAPAQIRWRKRPGLRSIEQLLVADGP